jgi:hypothetical protein
MDLLIGICIHNITFISAYINNFVDLSKLVVHHFVDFYSFMCIQL